MSHFAAVDSLQRLGLNIAAGGVPGDARSATIVPFYTTALADTSTVTVGTFTIPNIGTSMLAIIEMMSYFDASTTIYDSARHSKVSVIITRKVGVVGVGALIPYESSATNAVTNVNQLVLGTIATSAAGATFTQVIALGAESGGATASNTWALTVANTASAGSPTTSVFGICTLLNAAAGGATFSGTNA